MSIAALRMGVGGGGNPGCDRRIGCNAAVSARGVGECSSSSIGKESESSSAIGSGSYGQDESDEVQSSYKEPLCGLHALEESLPIRRGISRYYNGRSKSFMNLKASLPLSNSCKDIAKPDNPYNKKRKNNLAFNLMYQQQNSTNSENKNSSLDISSKRVKNRVSVFSVEERFSIPSRTILSSCKEKA